MSDSYRKHEESKLLLEAVNLLSEAKALLLEYRPDPRDWYKKHRAFTTKYLSHYLRVNEQGKDGES